MRSSDSIYQLVHSLNKTEKRYFKLFASTHKENSQPVQLFDILDDMAAYNPQALRRKTKGLPLDAHLEVSKINLQQLILRAMRSYAGTKKTDQLLNDMILDARFFFQKMLYPECAKTLSRARKMAEEGGLYLQLLEIIRMERALATTAGYEERTREQWTESYEAEKRCIHFLANEAEYKYLSDTLSYLSRRYGKARTEAERNELVALYENPFLSDEQMALTSRSKYLLHFCKSALSYTLGNYPVAAESFGKLAEGFEQNPRTIVENAIGYLSALYNATIINLLLYRFDAALANIAKMRQIPTLLPKQQAHSTDLHWRIFSRASLMEFAVYIKAARFAEARLLVGPIEEGLMKYAGYIDKTREAEIRFQLLYLDFIEMRYESALDRLNDFLQEKKSVFKQNYQAMFRLINIIIHYELGNYNLLEYLVRSAYRYLLRQQRNFKFETAILDFFRKDLPKTVDEKAVHQAMARFKSKIDELANDPLEKGPLEEFDLQSWLRAKLEKRPFSEVLRDKVLALGLV